ncbi:hypothetical protein BKA57DRAFT_452926, partial [Linnemannia elongata]
MTLMVALTRSLPFAAHGVPRITQLGLCPRKILALCAIQSFLFGLRPHTLFFRALRARYPYWSRYGAPSLFPHAAPVAGVIARAAPSQSTGASRKILVRARAL